MAGTYGRAAAPAGGRAVTAAYGRAAPQGPVNRSGMGVGAIRPQRPLGPNGLPLPTLAQTQAPTAPGQTQGVGSVQQAAQMAKMRGMMPQIPAPTLAGQGQPQMGQIQASIHGPHPLKPGEKTPTVQESIQNTINGRPRQLGGTGSNVDTPGEAATTAAGNATQVGNDVKDAAGNVVSGLPQFPGVPMDFINQIMKFMGINLGGGGAAGAVPGGGAGTERIPTATSGGNRPTDAGGGTGPSGSRGPAVVKAMPQFTGYQVGTKAAPAGVQPTAAPPGALPSTNGQPGAVQGSNLGKAPGDVSVPAGGYSQNNAQGAQPIVQAAAQQQKATPPDAKAQLAQASDEAAQKAKAAAAQQQNPDGSYQKGNVAASMASDGSWNADAPGSTPDYGDPGGQQAQNNWEAGNGAGNPPPTNSDGMSYLTQSMSDQDLYNFRNKFNPFNQVNRDANNALGQNVNDLMDKSLLNGGTQAMQDSLRTTTNAQRNEQLRMAESRAARGGVQSPGQTTGILGNATNAIAQGDRDITAGAFDRDMQRQGMLGNARNNLAQSLSQGNQFDYQNQLDNYTSNKEMFDMMSNLFGEVIPG